MADDNALPGGLLVWPGLGNLGGEGASQKRLDELQEMNVAALETELFGSFELAWT